jgi:hypothetical protein
VPAKPTGAAENNKYYLFHGSLSLLPPLKNKKSRYESAPRNKMNCI